MTCMLYITCFVFQLIQNQIPTLQNYKTRPTCLLPAAVVLIKAVQFHHQSLPEPIKAIT